MMEKSFLAQLSRHRLVFDGAMGSLLLAAGLPPGSAPEVWNVERGEVIEEIHAKYLAAGCDVITTNTFGGSLLKLGDYGLADKTADFNIAGVQCAMTARNKTNRPDAFVAGNIGPCGKFFPPVGNLDKKDLVKSLTAQIEVFATTSVDLILIETMVDLEEALIAVLTARSLTDLPVAVTITFDKKPRGYFTIMGNTPADAAQRLADAGADLVGANCTLAPAEMVELARHLGDVSPVPVLIQPNAGQPEVVEGETIYRMTPEEFATSMHSIVFTGVAAVGGCCGTTPAHLRALVALANNEHDGVES